MLTSAMLDGVEQACTLGRTGKTAAPDRAVLLDKLNEGIAEIVSMEEWDWAMVYVRPIVGLQASKRDYPLPANFGDNFVRHGYDDGTKWMCKLHDTTNAIESFIDYEAPAQFFSRNTASTSTGRIGVYTITSDIGGSRRIHFDPLPDATTGAWQVSGLYIPTDWSVSEEAHLPPLPGNAVILRYWLLKEIAKMPDWKDRDLSAEYETKYERQMAVLIRNAQRGRKSQFVLADHMINNYSQMEQY